MRASFAASTRQRLPSRRASARIASLRIANEKPREYLSRSVFGLLGRTDSATLGACREDVVEKFLLGLCAFLFVGIALAGCHVAQHLAVSVRGLVGAHLNYALPLECRKRFDQRLFPIARGVDLNQHALQLEGRERLVHCVVPRFLRTGDLQGELIDLMPRARNLQQDPAQCALFAFFHAVAIAKNRRKWKSKRHSAACPLSL